MRFNPSKKVSIAFNEQKVVNSLKILKILGELYCLKLCVHTLNQALNFITLIIDNIMHRKSKQQEKAEQAAYRQAGSKNRRVLMYNK